jgi:hypothetical protein
MSSVKVLGSLPDLIKPYSLTFSNKLWSPSQPSYANNRVNFPTSYNNTVQGVYSPNSVFKYAKHRSVNTNTECHMLSEEGSESLRFIYFWFCIEGMI